MGFEFLSPLAEKFCRQQGYELIHYDMSVTASSAEDLLTYRKADLIIDMHAVYACRARYCLQ